MTPRRHFPKGDLPKAACGAGWHLPLAARVLIPRRGCWRRSSVMGAPPGRVARGRVVVCSTFSSCSTVLFSNAYDSRRTLAGQI